MNRPLFAAILVSFSLLAACSASPESGATSEAAAISSPEPAPAPAPVAQPVDGSYKASCSDKYASIDLTVDIADGAVSKISGTLEGRDGKFRVGQPVTNWTGTISATAASIDATLARAILASGPGSSIAYDNETQVMQPDETTITTTGTCATSLSFASIEITPHNAGPNIYRSVVLHGVVANGATCDIANGPVDDTGDWYIECGEDEGAVSSEGLDVLTAILRGAKP